MFYNTAIAKFPNDRITNWRGTPNIKKTGRFSVTEKRPALCVKYTVFTV